MADLALAEAVPLAHALVDRVAQQRGVRALFIKGPVAEAQGLRHARTSLDVDALVDPARADDLLEGLGAVGWDHEQVFGTPTAATYSRTVRHDSWPCELDVHVRFPGFLAPRDDVFERLWARRTTASIAGRDLVCLDRAGQTLLLAVNALRDPHDRTKQRELAGLVERVRELFDAPDLQDLADLARDLGAAGTAAPFLTAVGAPAVSDENASPADLRAWRMRTQQEWRVATWVDGLRGTPKRSWPRYLWYATMLSEQELRLAEPDLARGRWSVLRARLRRLRRGWRAIPSAVRSIRGLETVGAGPTPVTSRAIVQTSWRSRQIPPPLVSLAKSGLGLADRLVVPKRGVVIRTFPDFDDQGLEMARALSEAGIGRVTWLTKSGEPSISIRMRLPEGVRTLDAGSFGAVWTYLRARVVVHTHGVYGVPGRSRRKIFVNLWHGMPIKRLDPSPPVAKHQTDLLTVTSPLHAANLRESWQLPESAVVPTGLPRNDRMVRAATEATPPALDDLAGGRPILLWLPTYRRSAVGDIRVDGREFGNVFEFPDTDVSSVGALADSLGVHILVKLHPMATGEIGSFGSVTVWDDAALTRAGLTLYELLGHADVLVTDHSSVWVDYLLLDRPIVFSIADLNQYADLRGHYFAPLSVHLPGPLAVDLGELESQLKSALHADTWAARRSELRFLHHAYFDGSSAQRLTTLVVQRTGHGPDRP